LGTGRDYPKAATPAAAVDRGASIPYLSATRFGGAADVQGGTEMGESRGNGRRVAQRVIALLAIGDVAYRLLAREPLRRALGIETSHA
jgi:hypothetical protein